MLSLNGDINTGIAIRTTYLRDGYATYPAGATLLYDSDPASEERETRLKANGFFRLLGTAGGRRRKRRREEPLKMKLLLVDNDDCFIHTLANYARQTGAEVVTYRAGTPFEFLDRGGAGPDSDLAGTGAAGRISACRRWCWHAARAGIPVFGVCLGLQGIVEAFGGELGCSLIRCTASLRRLCIRAAGVFEGLPEEIEVGRYHSLYAIPEKTARGA